jgi:hypothetical protein
MILNATILRIDSPGPADTGGSVPVVAGAACRIRCFLAERGRETRLEAGSPATDQQLVTTKLSIPASALKLGLKLAGYDPALRIGLNMQLLVQSDADVSPLAYTVWKATAAPKGSMGRVDVWCTQN